MLRQISGSANSKPTRTAIPAARSPIATVPALESQEASSTDTLPTGHQTKSPKLKAYDHLSRLFRDVVQQLRPPERLTVSQTAEKYRKLNNPGSYVGPWRNAAVPYMVEPMDELGARLFTSVIFVGPAQTGKTDALILNWLGHNIRSDAMDMCIYSPTTTMAKDFSIRRVDRFHRHSPDFGKYLLVGDDDNIYDKQYTNGILLTLGWPTISQTAGRPMGRVAITDYDRMPDDIGGEGSMFDLASKRTTTFGSFAMTLAESSPSRPLEKPRWVRVSAHEAPPCKGILALYNRGDRRRWYWPCPACEHYFVGAWEQLSYEQRDTPLATAETVKLVCPHCDFAIHPRQKKGDRKSVV